MFTLTLLMEDLKKLIEHLNYINGALKTLLRSLATKRRQPDQQLNSMLTGQLTLMSFH